MEKKGCECFVPTFPPIEDMSYKSWAKYFDKYRKYINGESVFIGHSTGSIFIVKYLMENDLKIAKYISVVGFNQPNTNSKHTLWEEINRTFLLKICILLSLLQKKEYPFIRQQTSMILDC